MNHLIVESPATLITPTPRRRYQIYRRDRNGCHHPHGVILESQEEAVTRFLHTMPEFEGGGLRLWDHREERVAGSAEWSLEKTGFGFRVWTRSNVFYDSNLSILAHVIADREALAETIASGFRTTV